MYDSDAVSRRFYDELFQRAARLVAEGKRHPPVVLTLTDTGIALAVGTTTLSADERAAIVMKMAADPGSKAIALITEAWYIDAIKHPDEAIQFMLHADQGTLEEYPGKQEAIIIRILTASRQAIMLCPIDRTTQSLQKSLFRWMDPHDREFGTETYRRLTRVEPN